MSTRYNQDEKRIQHIFESTRGLTFPQRLVRLRKSAQQTLLYLSDIISKYNRRYYTDSYDSSHGSQPGPPSSWKSGYRNILPIEKGSMKDPVSSLVNLGNDLTKFFTFDLTSAQQATLSPTIRLFKVEYDLDSDGKVMLPFREKTKREIVFDKAITDDELNILTEFGGNVGSSGIESFEWDLKGVNPAEVDSNIEASLKIYFNNIGVFKQRIEDLVDLADTSAAAASLGQIYQETRDPSIRGRQAAVTAEASRTSSRVNKQAHFMDLITFAPPTTKTTSQLPCMEEYQPHFFEIMAEVGWSIADAGLESVFTQAQKKYIEKQTITLYLTLADHKFDFKQDGSATLTVNYRARQSLDGSSYDILNPPPEMLHAIENLNILKGAAGDPDATSTEADTNHTDAENKVQTLKTENYKRIIDMLLRHVYRASIPNMLTLNLSPSIIGSAARRAAGVSDAMRPGSYSELLELLVLRGSIQNNNQDLIREYRELEKVIENIQSSNEQTIKVTKVYSDNVEDDIVSPEETWVPTDMLSPLRRGDFTEIDFFYLGDILEVLFETIPITNDISAGKIAVIVTDFEYLNLLKIVNNTSKSRDGKYKLLQQFDYAALKCGESELSKDQLSKFYSTINLANIPVESRSFIDFFTEKVISEKKTNYYLNNFISDLFNNLIKPMLGATSIPGIPNNQPAFLNLTIPAVDTRSGLFQHDNINTNRKGYEDRRPEIRSYESEYYVPYDFSQVTGRVWIATLDEYMKREEGGINEEKAVLHQNPSDSELNNTATVKIFAVNNGVKAVDGKYDENIKQGIANFVVGLDRGLIKSISFERVDQPYLRESRVAREKSFGAGQLRELYNVKLVLYGNNLLKPGQMIYVEPNRLIFGRPTAKRSVARLLGLGGYHLVVDVSNTIDLSGWETTVKALHMSMPTSVD